MPILILFGTLGLAVIGYAVYWFQLAGAVEDAVHDQLTVWRDQGIAVAYDELTVGGFPYRLQITAAQPAVTAARRARFDWQTDLIDVVAEPWDLNHWIAITDTPSRLTVVREGAGPDLEFTAAHMRSSLVVDGNGGWMRSASDLRQVALRAPERLDAITAERAELHVRRPETDAADRIDVALRLASVTLPAPVTEMLDRHIETVLIDATVAGPLPAAVDGAGLAAWRDAGGTVDLRQGQIAWGQIEVTTAGTLALDDQLRPIGALTAQLRGANQMIDGLAATGQLTEEAAIAARLVIALASSDGPDGGRVVELPLTLQDGEIHLGPIPIGRVGPVIESASN